MLIPIKANELWKLIPAVATGSQFGNCTNDPRTILQRVLVAIIGGVISLLISQSQLSIHWSPIWLIISFVFFLYLLWGPILKAGRLNAELRKYPAAAIFKGSISNTYTREQVEDRREQASPEGILELVENRRTLLCIELEDEDGYLGEIQFPMNKKHQDIRNGLVIYCVVLSEYSNFSRINAITDAWLPSLKIWVGTYPYLLRPVFEEMCLHSLNY
uniref:Uncharacterized protein n=1 Tax=Paulinella longichromatophora TaxID=1708747 RepID=A0A2H4ZQA0_9EUKA|nr:hypothetical protein PLO_734 [Paulinella longichromatophora]